VWALFVLCAGVEFEIGRAPLVDVAALVADTAADLGSSVAPFGAASMVQEFNCLSLEPWLARCNSVTGVSWE
jgi:hypothetical protein